MIEKYILSGKELPTLPTPHDCPIVEIETVDEFLIFKFGNDLNLYDSINSKYPKANSLIIKYHLTDSEVSTYIWKNRMFGKGYEFISNTKVIKKHNHLVYLYQYISYNSILIKLHNTTGIIIEFNCDYVEYDWL